MGTRPDARREAGGQIDPIAFLADIQAAPPRLDAFGQRCKGIGRSAEVQVRLQRLGLAGHSDLVADVNGVLAKSHIQDKLTHCAQMAEVAQGCAFGAGAAGKMHPSGVFMPDPLKVNAGLNYIKDLTGEHIQMLHDIGGGMIVTMPTEKDYRDPRLKKLMDFTLAGNEKYTSEERIRALYLCRELAATEFTGYYMGWGVNASGSPYTGQILVRSLYDLDYRMGIAKEWAGIGESKEWPGHCKTHKAWAGN